MPAGPLPPQESDVVKLTETDARLRVSRPWLHDAITAGTFPAPKTGAYFISWRAILGWVEARTAPLVETSTAHTTQLPSARLGTGGTPGMPAVRAKPHAG